MTVQYRVASEDDLPSICALGEEVNALHHNAWPYIFAGPGAAVRDRAWWAQSIGQEGSTTLVAESQGKLIAFVTVSVHDETNSLFRPSRYARVGSVSVTRDERGKGIGRKVMALAEQWALNRGAKDMRLTVWAFNEHALHVYSELGFVQRSINFGKQLAEPDA